MKRIYMLLTVAAASITSFWSAYAQVTEVPVDRFQSNYASVGPYPPGNPVSVVKVGKCESASKLVGIEYWTQPGFGYVDAKLLCRDLEGKIDKTDFIVGNGERRYSSTLQCASSEHLVGMQLLGEYNQRNLAEALNCEADNPSLFGLESVAELIAYYKTGGSKPPNGKTLVREDVQNSIKGICKISGKFSMGRYFGAINARAYCGTDSSTSSSGISSIDGVAINPHPDHTFAWSKPVFCGPNDDIISIGFRVTHGAGIVGLKLECG